jgi:hypothetical protein
VGKSAAGVVDEVRVRLRDAIAASDVDEEEQLNGVLRMLGEEIPEQNQLLLFGKGPAKPRGLSGDGSGR